MTDDRREPARNALYSKMIRDSKLADVISKYKNHPDFLGVEIADVNQPGAVDDTMLHMAARKGALSDIEVLVRAGASVNVPGDMGYTPLDAAAMGGSIGCVRKLLQLGADPLIRNELGETAASVAEQLKHGEIAEILHRHAGKCGTGSTKAKRGGGHSSASN